MNGTSVERTVTEVRAVFAPGATRSGRVVAVDGTGRVWVEIPGLLERPVPARVCRAGGERIASLADPAGSDVLLAFDERGIEDPIVVDLVDGRLPAADGRARGAMELEAGEAREVVVDGRRISFDAREQITLTCGEAQIEMRSDGRITIRGVDVVSRAARTNRIKGGYVRIN